MRRISNEGIPAICKGTLIDQAIVGLSWEILNSHGGTDATTTYFTMLLNQANDGEGAGPFFGRLSDDVLTTLQGGHFEIALSPDDIPVALYNVDSATIEPTNSEEYPWLQSYKTIEVAKFRDNEMAHVLWHPYTEIGLVKQNRTPISLAYQYIIILAAADDWNFDLLSDPFPAGVLSLPGATPEEVEAFKMAWDNAISGGKLRDIAVIYGLDLKQAQHIKLTRPPTDMAFEVTDHWYASLVAAAFEMSILDISILTRVSTKAGAESQERTSQQQGQRKLRKVVQASVENWILPEGYNFRWIVPKPEDEETQAAADERRARALFYLIQGLGPEAGYETAVDMGVIPVAGVPKQAEHFKSGVRELIIKADLRGGIHLSEWEDFEGSIVTYARRPPSNLWGKDLYQWTIDNYEEELLSALDLWHMDVEEERIAAEMTFRRQYQDALRRAAVRSFVAGKQEEEASNLEEATAIALMLLTAWEINRILRLVREDESYFNKFMTVLKDEGEGYTRADWRTKLYVPALRRMYDEGRFSTADEAEDLVVFLEGVVKTEHCEICPTMWNKPMTFKRLRELGGHSSSWCLGGNNCACSSRILRGAARE